jgi:hypothetical protein
MECLLLAAGDRSDKAIVDNWVRRRMVKGDGRPGRGRATAEEDDDEYNSRMEFPPDDVIAAFERQQVKQDKRENICAAGAACTAHKSADLAASTHRCYGCGLKVHSSILCGKSLDTLLIDQPSLVGHTLPGGRVISDEGADNEMHCVCFTCIGKMTTAGCVGVDFAAAGKENIVDGSNPIENCSWDDVAVTTTLTNAASRTKKGESLKVTNATRLQGFRINDELIPTASIVKDHLQRWAIRKNKPRARRLAKQPLCEAIVQWKGEHDRSVANGTVELINPSTNMPLRFNMKRFVNVMFGHTMLPQLAKRGRVLTAGDLEDGKRTDQDLFQNFLVQYNDSGKPSYSHHGCGARVGGAKTLKLFHF